MSRKHWTPADDAIMRARYPHERTEDLARVFGCSIRQLYTRAKALTLKKTPALLASLDGITTDPITGDRFRAGRRLWSAREDAIIRARYAHESTVILAREMRRTPRSVWTRARQLGLKKTQAYRQTMMGFKKGTRIGAAFWFHKGQTPPNKGLRRRGYAPGRMASTQFKPGVSSWRWMPIGATRLIDGYVCRKVSAIQCVPYNVNWKPEHLLIWTAAHGPLPAGHAIVFKNGNRLDLRLENLELVTKAEIMRRNSIHTVLPPDLKSAVIVLGALKRQIRRRSHASEKQDR